MSMSEGQPALMDARFECGCWYTEVGAERHPPLTGEMACPIHRKGYGQHPERRPKPGSEGQPALTPRDEELMALDVRQARVPASDTWARRYAYDVSRLLDELAREREARQQDFGEIVIEKNARIRAEGRVRDLQEIVRDLWSDQAQEGWQDEAWRIMDERVCEALVGLPE